MTDLETLIAGIAYEEIKPLSLEIAFSIPGTPRGRTQPNRSKQGHFYHKKETQAELDYVTRIVRENTPETPHQGPVALHVAYYLPIPSSWPKWKRRAARLHLLHPTAKPDWDNLTKLTQDAMTRAGYWKDDAQVTLARVAKFYSDKPGTDVRVLFMPPIDRKMLEKVEKEAGLAAQLEASNH